VVSGRFEQAGRRRAGHQREITVKAHRGKVMRKMKAGSLSRPGEHGRATPARALRRFEITLRALDLRPIGRTGFTPPSCSRRESMTMGNEVMRHDGTIAVRMPNDVYLQRLRVLGAWWRLGSSPSTRTAHRAR